MSMSKMAAIALREALLAGSPGTTTLQDEQVWPGTEMRNGQRNPVQESTLSRYPIDADAHGVRPLFAPALLGLQRAKAVSRSASRACGTRSLQQMVADRRPVSVGGRRLSPDTRRPSSVLPVTPLLGHHLNVHNTRLTVDTEWRRPDSSSASPFATRSSTPFFKQTSPNESRPWTRDSQAALSSSPTRAATADGRRGTRRKASWPIDAELSRPNSRSPEIAHQSLMPLPRLAAQHGSPLLEDVWQSPLLEAEVELGAAPHATHEERGLLAVQLLSALASQSSPFQALLTRCVEALRPCVFVCKATAASATPLEKGAAAPGDVTHMSMSAKLSAEVAELRRLLHSSREAFDQARQMLLAEHEAHAECKLKLAACQLQEEP